MHEPAASPPTVGVIVSILPVGGGDARVSILPLSEARPPAAAATAETAAMAGPHGQSESNEILPEDSMSEARPPAAAATAATAATAGSHGQSESKERDEEVLLMQQQLAALLVPVLQPDGTLAPTEGHKSAARAAIGMRRPRRPSSSHNAH